MDILSAAEMLGVSFSNAREQKVTCPFCGKKRRLALNSDKNLFRCWTPSCIANAGGNTFDLLAVGMFNTAKYKDLLPEQKKEIRNAAGMNDHTQLQVKRPKRRLPPEPKIASDHKLNQFYSALLSLLSLSKSDVRELRDRGMTDTAIATNGYKTLAIGHVEGSNDYIELSSNPKWKDILSANGIKPTERKLKEIARGFILVEKMKGLGFSDFTGVPGFFKFQNRWCMRVLTGMVIPVRNAYGEIVSLCIHDKDRPGSKYISFSTSNMNCGTKAIARVHVPLASSAIARPARSMVVTEGILKADVTCCLLGQKQKAPIVGVPGVDSMKDLPGMMTEFNPPVIFDAFDADKVLKPGVWRGSQNLKSLASSQGRTVRVMYWDREWCEKEKLRELLQLTKNNSIAVPDWVRTTYRKNPWLCVQCLAELLWPFADSLPDQTFEWRDLGKGIDDNLLRLSKVAENDFYCSD